MIAFDFGERLRQLREQHNLSQEEMGRRVGRSKPVISNYENNLKKPTLDVLIDIAALYNVSLDYLIGFEKKEMISIEGLSNTQKEIVHHLLCEFKDKNQQAIGLNEHQQSILCLLIKEFSKKKRNIY